MKTVRYHRLARVELIDGSAYYTCIDPTLGVRFEDAVQAAVRLAAERPELGSPYDHGTRRVFPKKFPYAVVYVVSDSEVLIVSVAATRRKPGYWASRV